MKTLLYSAPDGRGTPLALPVPAGTVNGRPTFLGDGLVAVPFTDRVTPEIRAANRAPQGVPNGWASCFLPSVTMVLAASAFTGGLPAGVQQYERLYLHPNGSLDNVASGALQFLGWAIPLPAPMGGLGVGIASTVIDPTP